MREVEATFKMPRRAKGQEAEKTGPCGIW